MTTFLLLYMFSFSNAKHFLVESKAKHYLVELSSANKTSQHLPQTGIKKGGDYADEDQEDGDDSEEEKSHCMTKDECQAFFKTSEMHCCNGMCVQIGCHAISDCGSGFTCQAGICSKGTDHSLRLCETHKDCKNEFDDENFVCDDLNMCMYQPCQADSECEKLGRKCDGGICVVEDPGNDKGGSCKDVADCSAAKGAANCRKSHGSSECVCVSKGTYPDCEDHNTSTSTKPPPTKPTKNCDEPGGAGKGNPGTPSCNGLDDCAAAVGAAECRTSHGSSECVCVSKGTYPDCEDHSTSTSTKPPPTKQKCQESYPCTKSGKCKLEEGDCVCVGGSGSPPYCMDDCGGCVKNSFCFKKGECMCNNPHEKYPNCCEKSCGKTADCIEGQCVCMDEGIYPNCSKCTKDCTKGGKVDGNCKKGRRGWNCGCNLAGIWPKCHKCDPPCKGGSKCMKRGSKYKCVCKKNSMYIDSKCLECVAPKRIIGNKCVECVLPKRWVGNECIECLSPKQFIGDKCVDCFPSCQGGAQCKLNGTTYNCDCGENSVYKNNQTCERCIPPEMPMMGSCMRPGGKD